MVTFRNGQWIPVSVRTIARYPNGRMRTLPGTDNRAGCIRQVTDLRSGESYRVEYRYTGRDPQTGRIFSIPMFQEN